MFTHLSLGAPDSGDGADAIGLGKMFSDPNLLGKLATNPKTQKHLADPAFVQKVLVVDSQLVYFTQISIRV